MGLNKTRGNMYEFITHTWNAIKGVCPHDCTYCYVKRWGKRPELHLSEKELRCDLGKNNYIFVGSSCDMFADDIPGEWVVKTLNRCNEFQNAYFFQTKNPAAFLGWGSLMPETVSLCITIETNRIYPQMGSAPDPITRAYEFAKIPENVQKYVTIEPIMDFDLGPMVTFIRMIRPDQVNIGADSGTHKLPEPSADKIQTLIGSIEDYTTIHLKKNLKRLLP